MVHIQVLIQVPYRILAKTSDFILVILLLHWHLEPISLKNQSVSLLKGNRNAKRLKDKSCQLEIFFIYSLESSSPSLNRMVSKWVDLILKISAVFQSQTSWSLAFNRIQKYKLQTDIRENPTCQWLPRKAEYQIYVCEMLMKFLNSPDSLGSDRVSMLQVQLLSYLDFVITDSMDT